MLLFFLRPHVAGGEPPVEPPAPAPATTGVPGGRSVRIAVRIDGKMYVGSYDEISAMVAALGERDALAEAQQARPVTTKRKARVKARRAAGAFDKSMQVIDIGVPTLYDFGAFDPAPVAQKDLREDYLRAYAVALLAAEQQAAIQTQAAMQMQAEQQAAAREAQRRRNNEVAARAAEALLLDD